VNVIEIQLKWFDSVTEVNPQKELYTANSLLGLSIAALMSSNHRSPFVTLKFISNIYEHSFCLFTHSNRVTGKAF